MALESRDLHLQYVLFFLALCDVQLLTTLQVWPPLTRFGLHLSGFVEYRMCLMLDLA